ncbi:hypothetical protein, partial [Klebsiella pneumoniae]|uniref:hypothetical protein n=1 Tax=Klebsiella pneumoniae TaxID=573 RepID=UPI0013D55F77
GEGSSIALAVGSVGNYSGAFSINSQKDVIESGQTVNYNIYLKITGPNTRYQNAKLVINLLE